mgnify:CR=1 FL=1
MNQEQSANGITLDIKNVGGIERQEISIDPGLTVLSGENATNRTSLLKAIMALAGSDDVPIRSGTEHGFVKGEINGEEYEREVEASGDGYRWSGEGYCDDPLLAELYAFLLEQNEVRQTVSTSGDLRELIMRPVDTDEIEARKTELLERKRELNSQEDDREEKKANIERLKQTIESKKEEKEGYIEEKSALEDQIDNFDGDISQQESKFKEANSLQGKTSSLGSKIRSAEDKLSRLESSLENREEELSQLRENEHDESIPEIQQRIEDINQEISNLKEKQKTIDKEKEALSPLRSFLGQITSEIDLGEINRIISENSDLSRQSAGASGGDITSELVSGSSDQEICALCGSEVEPGHYEHLDSAVGKAYMNLNSQGSEIGSKISSLSNEKDDLESKIADVRESNERKKTLTEQIERLEEEVKSQQDDIQELKADKEALESELDAIEQELEDDVQKLIEMNRDLSELENNIEQAESTIERRKDELENAKSELEELETSEDELKEINDELEELRNKIDNIESSVIEQFNERMEDILSRLEYTGIERIWIQSRRVEKRKGRSKVTESVFDLNIVREVDGETTQDTIDNLSESEREVTGLIFALTGYLVHDVADVFPVTLMDSIEMVDSNRIEQLLQYYGQYTEYLIVAALPADADQIDVGEGDIVEMTN